MNLKNFVLAIDPGLSGAFVLTNGKRLQLWEMPIQTDGKNKAVCFSGVLRILKEVKRTTDVRHIFLERAMPMAMGSKHAFNYGRGFAALEIAIIIVGLPYTLVDPAKWAKVMHEGISTDLKPKAKSLIAVKRLCPHLVKFLPKGKKNGKFFDGPIDALLIATYGLRLLSNDMRFEPEDFY